MIVILTEELPIEFFTLNYVRLLCIKVTILFLHEYNFFDLLFKFDDNLCQFHEC